jgi:cobaltochelatase CobT
MATIQQQARRQQRVEELCGAAIRALTGDPELHMRAHGLYRGQKRVPLYAPHLRTDAAAGDIGAHRGTSDGMALRLLHSDAELHRSLSPEEPIQRLMFELLEQLRVESLVPPDKPGMAGNLERRFVSWSLQYHHAGLTGSELGILLYTLAQVCWARLNACRVVEETEDLIEATRARIVPRIGRQLAALKRDRGDQARFACAALAIARQMHVWIRDAGAGQPEGADDDAADAADSALNFLLDFDQEGDAGVASLISGRSDVFADAAAGYRVFSKRYDRESGAAELVRPALLGELRTRLDRLIADQGVNARRLARQLAAIFAQPQRDGWSFGEEEGYIDGRRLAQVVSSPDERRLFRRELFQPQPHALFSLLIDCSGSMKAHIESIAVLVDVFARALQQAGVASEVLGFTTGAWNGGRVQRDWMAAGRPNHPGRLNELSYMIYKDAESSWRRARPSIAAMLKPDLFREGIDGEAIDWACARMLGRSETRRVLVVISDGCPMDAATNLANDRFYLDNHLKEVVARRERQGEVEIFGVGVGLDLSPYYRRRLVLDLTRGVDNRVFDEIVGLLRRPRPA